MYLLQQTSLEPQSSQIAETLLLLTRSLPAPTSEASSHLLQLSTVPTAASNAIFPAEQSLPLRSAAVQQAMATTIKMKNLTLTEMSQPLNRIHL